MYTYFQKYQNDVVFYEEHLQKRLPQTIIDAHAHYNLPEHVSNITQETIDGDWALECGLLMSKEDAAHYYSVLFPHTQMYSVALPWPLFDADTPANNAYVAGMINDQTRALMVVRPEYTPDYVEAAFLAGRFSGFKPYPYMASRTKGADVSIFDFMPKTHFAIANKYKASVLMHLPRAGRLPDPDNIAEIRTILNDYPDIRLVIAHFGRCFNVEYFEQALAALGEDVHSLWFDTAAVLNPAVYDLAFSKLDYRKILFGTDFPILLWHGKREWKNGTYINLCREDFSWNQHYYPSDEKNYTFFVYEQLKTILDRVEGDTSAKNAVFFDNAYDVYFTKQP